MLAVSRWLTATTVTMFRGDCLADVELFNTLYMMVHATVVDFDYDKNQAIRSY